MGLETPTYISDLNTAWPLGSDAKSTADDHLRNFKSAVKNTFPSVTGAVTVTHTDLNTVTAKGNIAGQTWTGTHTFPSTTYGVTATAGDSSTLLATTAFVAATAFSSALPAQLGNSGKLLTTNGTAGSWTSIKTVNGNALVGAGDVGIGLNLLATLTPTAAANVDFLTTFTSSYDNYLVIIDGVKPSANDALVCRVAVGGSVDSGSNYYVGLSGSGVSASSTNIGTTSNVLSAGIGTSGTMFFLNANDSTNIKVIDLRTMSQDTATPSYNPLDYRAAYKATNAISGFRLYWSAGANFQAVGKIRVYGYQNS